MKIAKKLWLWMFEFRVRKLRDKEKIEFLTRELLKEVESQGYSLKSTNDVYGLDVNIYTSTNELVLSNISSHWEVRCGKYYPVMGKFEPENTNEVLVS